MSSTQSSTTPKKTDELYSYIIKLKNLTATSDETPADLQLFDWLLELNNYRKEKERELKRFLDECPQ